MRNRLARLGFKQPLIRSTTVPVAMRRLFLPLALVFLVPAAVAQSSSQDVVERMRDAYAAMYEGVDDYTIETDLYTMVYEREPDGGPLAFRSAMKMDGVPGGDAMDMGGAGLSEEQLQQMADGTTYEGTADVAGQAAHVLYAADLSDFDENIEAGSGRFYISADTWMPVKMEMSAVQDGRPIEMEMRFLDYRTVDGITYPFLTQMEMKNLNDAMSAEDRAQLEQMERELANMPAEQRAMMERMLGDQLDKLKEAMATGSFTQEVRVQQITVNGGVPAGTFED